MTYELSLFALSDPMRLRLFEALATRPQAVVDLAARLPISRPAVSQHLKVLSDAGLIAVKTEGTRRIYSARPEALAELRVWLDGFWDRALAGLAAETQGTKETSDD